MKFAPDEAFGLVAVEAQLRGIPVVSWRIKRREGTIRFMLDICRHCVDICYMPCFFWGRYHETWFQRKIHLHWIWKQVPSTRHRLHRPLFLEGLCQAYECKNVPWTFRVVYPRDMIMISWISYPIDYPCGSPLINASRWAATTMAWRRRKGSWWSRSHDSPIVFPWCLIGIRIVTSWCRSLFMHSM